MPEPIERNLGFELVRATEAAALNAARWMGKGDRNAADQAAVDAMRFVLSSVVMDGIVVIGEGEKDEAPMLYIGEPVGTGDPPPADLAVDPIDGTRLLANGLPGAISVVALAKRDTLYAPRHIVYMHKLIVGQEARGVIDLDAPAALNLRAIAEAKRCGVEDLTVVVLDRPRHADLIAEIRRAGARIKLISDGDVAAGVAAALPDTGVDVLMGIGGAPEAVITACAVKALGGDMQCRPYARDRDEQEMAEEAGVDFDRVLRLDDLVQGDDVFFAATGITSGEMLGGVRFFGGGAHTSSLIIRGKSGTIRHLESTHDFRKLQEISSLQYTIRDGG
jgi:fructose-1,6-bisphosphatase II